MLTGSCVDPPLDSIKMNPFTLHECFVSYTRYGWLHLHITGLIDGVVAHT